MLSKFPLIYGKRFASRRGSQSVAPVKTALAQPTRTAASELIASLSPLPGSTIAGMRGRGRIPLAPEPLQDGLRLHSLPSQSLVIEDLHHRLEFWNCEKFKWQAFSRLRLPVSTTRGMLPLAAAPETACRSGRDQRDAADLVKT